MAVMNPVRLRVTGTACVPSVGSGARAGEVNHRGSQIDGVEGALAIARPSDIAAGGLSSILTS